jgi:hypothetical protein
VDDLWSVHADEDACDLAMRAPGAGRVAADEVFVRGTIAEDIRRAILTVDPDALMREASEGWGEVALIGDHGRDLFARLSELRLPELAGYVQGDVARTAARVFVDRDAILVLVPASCEGHLRRRVEQEAARR